MIEVTEEVAEALAAGRPVVALESTIIAHGLPRPDNLPVAREIEDAVRAEGAVPATIAVVGGYERTRFGGGQIITRDPHTGVIVAGSEPRKDGAAVGW